MKFTVIVAIPNMSTKILYHHPVALDNRKHEREALVPER